MRLPLFSLLILSLAAAPMVVAQSNPADYTTTLVPLVSQGLRGANGSVWDSELFVFNGSHLPLVMPRFSDSPVLTIEPSLIIDPHSTVRINLYPRDGGADGAFLHVPNTLVNSTKMSLRVRDTSQNATSLGDEVPVVRADQAGHELTIFDVPVDPKYRATLRIYGFTPAPMQVGVTIYSEDGNTPLAYFDQDLQGIAILVADPFPSHPAYAAINPLTAAVRAAAAGSRVRIQITNYAGCCTPPLRVAKIWAFVSLTNNETNQVTIVTPK